MLVSFAIHIVVHQSQSWIPMKSFESLVTILGAIAGYPPLAFAVWGCALVGSMVPVPSAVASPTDVATKVRGQVRKTARRARGIDLLVPGLQLLMPGLIWLGSHLFFPMLLSRYCLIALLPLAVLASRAIAFLSSRLLLFTVALAIIGLSTRTSTSSFRRSLSTKNPCTNFCSPISQDGIAAPFLSTIHLEQCDDLLSNRASTNGSGW
jgi:hypothetical protein